MRQYFHITSYSMSVSKSRFYLLWMHPWERQFRHSHINCLILTVFHTKLFSDFPPGLVMKWSGSFVLCVSKAYRKRGGNGGLEWELFMGFKILIQHYVSPHLKQLITLDSALCWSWHVMTCSRSALPKAWLFTKCFVSFRLGFWPSSHIGMVWFPDTVTVSRAVLGKESDIREVAPGHDSILNSEGFTPMSHYDSSDEAPNSSQVHSFYSVTEPMNTVSVSQQRSRESRGYLKQDVLLFFLLLNMHLQSIFHFVLSV